MFKKLMMTSGESQNIEYKHSSQPFNPEIASVFFRAGEIEAWGRGIERIVTACKDYGAEAPEWSFDGTGIWVTFKLMTTVNNQKLTYSDQVSGTDDGKMPKTDNENVQDSKEMSKREKRYQAIISLILKDSHVSLETMAETLAVNPKTIWRDLTDLRKNGIIERSGGDYGGEWVVISIRNQATD